MKNQCKKGMKSDYNAKPHMEHVSDTKQSRKQIYLHNNNAMCWFTTRNPYRRIHRLEIIFIRIYELKRKIPKASLNITPV